MRTLLGLAVWGWVAGVAAQPSILPEAPSVQIEPVLGNDNARLLYWTPGRCTQLYRVWRFSLVGWSWRVFATTTETEMVVPVLPRRMERWRVSAVCEDGSEWVAVGGEVVVNPGPWEEEVP